MEDCRKIQKKKSFETKLGIGHWQNAYYTHTGVGHLRNRVKKHFEDWKVPLCVNTHTGYVYYSHAPPPSPHLIVQCYRWRLGGPPWSETMIVLYPKEWYHNWKPSVCGRKLTRVLSNGTVWWGTRQVCSTNFKKKGIWMCSDISLNVQQLQVGGVGKTLARCVV